MDCDFCYPDKGHEATEHCPRCNKCACRLHAPIVRDMTSCRVPASWCKQN
jgi:hypothetical protein